MKLSTRIIPCILICFVLSIVGNTQDQKKNKNSKSDNTSAQSNKLTLNQQNALYALDGLFDSAKRFESEILKIRTQAQVADMLWDYDKLRAQNLFEEAFANLNLAINNNSNVSNSQFNSIFAPSPIIQLQNDVLSLITQRDPELAKKLIDKLIKKKTEKTNDFNAQSSNKANNYSLYLQAALSIASSDPNRATQLAKASLAGGVHPDILKVLFAIKETKPEMADDLFRATLLVARQDLKSASANIAILAPYALPEFASAGLGNIDSSANRSATDLLNFAYDTYLQISGLALALGMANSTNQAPSTNPLDYMTGRRLLPSFSRYMPDKLGTFQQALDAIAQKVPKDKTTDAADKFFQTGTTDEILEQAETEKNTILKDLLYIRAAMSVVAKGDFEKALTISSKINDLSRRESLSSIINLQASSAMLVKDDIEAALRYAKGVIDLRQRAFLYSKIARSLADKNDMVRANEVLSDAEQTINKAEDSIIKANALLIITDVKSRYDLLKGFEALEVAVKAFNKANSIDNNKNPKGTQENKSILTETLNNVSNLETPNFNSVFSKLAPSDFFRAIQIARSLENNEFSALAQIAVCRSVLSQQQKKQTAAISRE